VSSGPSDAASKPRSGGELKHALRSKIQRVLDRRITNEMQVVYLLVELRKLMDQEAYQDQILRMFCNWAVHTTLEKRGDGSTLILGEFDDFIAELRERKTLAAKRAHMSFGTFREALIRYFEHFGLSAKFADSLEGWKRFFSLYASVVSECPIVFTAAKRELKYIKRVELQRVSRGIIVKEWPVLYWRVTFHDGTTQNWGFHLG
jgi:hypothetical protein